MWNECGVRHQIKHRQQIVLRQILTDIPPKYNYIKRRPDIAICLSIWIQLISIKALIKDYILTEDL